jgi:hypothetical protein
MKGTGPSICLERLKKIKITEVRIERIRDQIGTRGGYFPQYPPYAFMILVCCWSEWRLPLNSLATWFCILTS